MTVDLRAINAVMVPMTWPMPHFEVVMANLEGSTCYFSLNCFHFKLWIKAAKNISLWWHRVDC